MRKPVAITEPEIPSFFALPPSLHHLPIPNFIYVRVPPGWRVEQQGA
jgi:hypothetical protein